MKIALLSPTVFEISKSLKHLEAEFEFKDGIFTKDDLSIKVQVSGVGMVNTSLRASRIIQEYQPDLCILIGVAGTFKEELEIGTVVHVVEEMYGDLGVEDAEGNFISIFELGLAEADQFPFKNKRLINESKDFAFLKKVRSISLNTSSGFAPNIEKLKNRFNVDIENMEGAAFFQTCMEYKVPFLEIRSISNKVESRNKEKWNLPLAIENLNNILLEMIQSIS